MHVDTPKVGNAVGARVIKIDAQSKVDGSEVFGADKSPPDSLWVRAVRSPHWSATFSIGDLGPLFKSYPGLVKVLTAADVPGLNGFGGYPKVKDQPIFADGDVRYRGEAVLALVGDYDTIYSLRDDEVPIEYVLRSPIQGMDAASSDNSTLVHKNKPGNVMASGLVRKGDVETAFADSDFVVEGRFETAFVEHAYIEPEAGWARRVGDRLEVAASTQAPHMDRDEIANFMGLPVDSVRVLPVSCGGGFGGKVDLAIQTLLAVAAWHVDRPVRAVYTRIESMASDNETASFENPSSRGV